MDIYKVGGAVRDHLLGYPAPETDWVVVGATPDDLLAQGYTQVGRDFPVFLHPVTREEYALARTERKSGHGYHGFVVHAEPTVTLEQDLERRDLTVNAMAMTDTGAIIDPYGGQQDLAAKLLRHVSPHFVEDPLRVLRVARFAARYSHRGFTIAPETLALMANIVAAGELAHLSVERIWLETERALGERDPVVFFGVLNVCGALARLLPGLTDTDGLARLVQVSAVTPSTRVRWAALVSPLAAALPELQARLRVPKAHAALAEALADYPEQFDFTAAEGVFAALTRLDALRREQLLTDFAEAIAALDDQPLGDHPTGQLLLAARSQALAINAADLAEAGLAGPALGDAIRARRIAAIAGLIDI